MLKHFVQKANLILGYFFTFRYAFSWDIRAIKVWVHLWSIWFIKINEKGFLITSILSFVHILKQNSKVSGLNYEMCVDDVNLYKKIKNTLGNMLAFSMIYNVVLIISRTRERSGKIINIERKRWHPAHLGWSVGVSCFVKKVIIFLQKHWGTVATLLVVFLINDFWSSCLSLVNGVINYRHIFFVLFRIFARMR